MQREGNGFFVKRVQTAIADELKVQIVDLTQSQKQSLVAAAQQKLWRCVELSSEELISMVAIKLHNFM